MRQNQALANKQHDRQSLKTYKLLLVILVLYCLHNFIYRNIHPSISFIYSFIKPIQKFLVWEVIAMIPALVMGGLSLAGGLASSKS